MKRKIVLSPSQHHHVLPLRRLAIQESLQICIKHVTKKEKER